MMRERELKYNYAEDNIPLYEELFVIFEGSELEPAQAITLNIQDSYLDTPDAHLEHSGLALRYRLQNGEKLATLKTRGDTQGALHSREELELAAHDGLPAAILERLPVGETDLNVQIVLNTERLSYPLLLKGKPIAMLAFDKVSACIPDSDTSVEFHELEIEAIGSTPDRDLEAIAAHLAKHLTLSQGSVTKLERSRVLLSLGTL